MQLDDLVGVADHNAEPALRVNSVQRPGELRKDLDGRAAPKCHHEEHAPVNSRKRLLSRGWDEFDPVSDIRYPFLQ